MEQTSALVYIVYDASDGEYYLYSNREEAETMLRGFLDDLIDADVMKTLPNLKQNLIGSYIAKIETELIIDEDTGKLIEFDI